MSQATKDFFDWQNAYWEYNSQTTDSIEDLEAFRHNFAVLVGVLPIVLEPIAIEATKAGIDPSPIINLSGGLPLFRQNTKQLELMLDAVWTVVKRLELLEGVENAKTQPDDPNGKRDNKRENGKRFVPYKHCYRHPDLKIQAAAGHLNRIGITRGKAKALKVYFDTEWEGQEGPMSLEDAETMLDTMKKIEQRGREQAGH